MDLNIFDYPLPETLIARQPAEPRDSCRLMVYRRQTGEIIHSHFHQIDSFLNPGDTLALNDSKVIPARLHGCDDQGKPFEVFLLSRETQSGKWKCLAKPGKKIKSGITVHFNGAVSGALKKIKDELCEIEFTETSPLEFWKWLEKEGKIPLPPYIKRPADSDDCQNYQTVFAKTKGSVAAPTAGLHFTEALFQKLYTKQIESAFLTLHVGYGTFSPIRAQNIHEHEMHEENYYIGDDTFLKLSAAKKFGKKIVAVGTTSLRALESIPSQGTAGTTRLFITPGFQFQWVDALITNFHLPKSSLLILVSAFMGKEEALRCYDIAMQEKYRFFSYGDAMLIL